MVSTASPRVSCRGRFASWLQQRLSLFSCNGAQATIDFLKRVFYAEELRTFPSDEGGLLHAEVRVDDTLVMLADSAEGWPPTPAFVHVYVRDVDATNQRADVVVFETHPFVAKLIEARGGRQTTLTAKISPAQIICQYKYDV